MESGLKEILELINLDRRLLSLFDEAARRAGPVNITGVCEQQKGYLIAALSYKYDKKPVIIEPDVTRAKSMIGALAPFTGNDIPVLKPAELSLVSAVAASHEQEYERAGVTSRLLRGEFDAAIICASALLNKMPKAEVFKRKSIKLELGKTYEPSDLAAHLSERGYERVGLVSAVGEFSARGDVVDVFPPDMPLPIRIGFFDDEIDQIKTFNLDNQRSVDSMKRVTICPALEYTFSVEERGKVADSMLHAAAPDINKMNASSQRPIGELLERNSSADADAVRQGMRISGFARWIGVANSEPQTILDYIDKNNMLLFVDEFAEGRSRMDGYTADYMARVKSAYELGQAPGCATESIFKAPDSMKALDKFGGAVTLACLKSTSSGLPGGVTVDCPGLAGENWVGRDEALANFIRNGGGAADGQTIFMLTGTSRCDAFKTRMLEQRVDIKIVNRALPSGFVYPAIKTSFVGEQEIFGAEKKHVPKKNGGARITFFGDVAPGDYVVHDVHGIGLYEGLVNLKMGKSNQDYLKISYAKNAVIYLPIDKIDKLSKYVGPGGKPPKLSSLDSGEWKKNVEQDFLRERLGAPLLTHLYRYYDDLPVDALEIDGLVVIGGDGSFHGAEYLCQLGIPCVCIPGTIDNDLAYTEMTLGYDTAVNVCVNAVRAIRATSRSHDRPHVVEVMGRHCGDIALTTAVSTGAEIVLCPEVRWSVEEVARRLNMQLAKGNTRATIIVAEGCWESMEPFDMYTFLNSHGKRCYEGEPISANRFASIMKRMCGNVEVRSTVIGYTQRGAEPTARDSAFAFEAGNMAVRLLRDGISNQVIGMREGKVFYMSIDTALKEERVFNQELFDLVNAL